MKKSFLKTLTFSALLGGIISTPVSAVNILLTNDDGYESKGLQQIKNKLTSAGHTVFLSVPATQQSGKGTGMTTSQPLDYTTLVTGEEWSINGTPVDAVNAGLNAFLANQPIDIVISGINSGDNTGKILNHSGTVSAATYAIKQGVPAFAISVQPDFKSLFKAFQLLSDDNPDNDAEGLALREQALENENQAYESASNLALKLLDTLVDSPFYKKNSQLLPSNLGFNINVPARIESEQKGVLLTHVGETSFIDIKMQLSPDQNQLIPAAITNPKLMGYITGQIDETELDFAQEGEALIAGYSTISLIDGDWSNTQKKNRKNKKLKHYLKKKLSISNN